MNYQAVVIMITAIVSGFGLQSCSLSGGVDHEYDNSDPYGLKAYQRAGGRVTGAGGGVVTRVSGVTADPVGGLRGEGITPEEDIVWAPEDPEQAMGSGMEQLWKKPENKRWHQSYTEATRSSRQTGKPLLIWFTDSMRSPICPQLNQEVFSTNDFEEWASERVVRLMIDRNISSRENASDSGARKLIYIKKLIKRYGVQGSPTVLLLKPDGEVYASYRGYKQGDSDYYTARMKQAVVMIEKGLEEWRKKYEKRGYRLWTSQDGRETFAKLYRYNSDGVTLINPDGKRGKTDFKNLSDADQAWILLQKKKRDARQRL